MENAGWPRMGRTMTRLDRHAKEGHARDGAEHGQPEGKAHQRHACQAAEGAQHHEFALGKAHGFRAFVDQHETQRDEAIDAALRKHR